MKSLLSSLLLLYFLSNISSAQVSKKTIELPEFRSIYLNSNYAVYLKQTNKQEVVVETLPDVLAASEFKVENGILMINIKREEPATKSIWQKIDDIKLNTPMNIYVSMKNVTELQVNGAGKIVAENSIASNDLVLAVNAAGNLDIDVKGEKIRAELTGPGTLSLRGYATSLNVLLAGSGSLTAFNCPVETATVKLSGSGTCELNVTEDLDAVVMGTGQVRHKGNTKNAVKKVYGNGAVARAY